MNVAGLGGKDRGFWKELEEWDVIVMSETWVEEKGWGRVKDKLPAGFICKMQAAKRRNKEGRAMGGMFMGIRWELADMEKEFEEKEKEGKIKG